MADIVEIFAFLATEADGEGVTAFLQTSPAGDQWMPLIAADVDRVDALREKAQEISDNSGLTLTLARFTERTDLETITPMVKQ